MVDRIDVRGCGPITGVDDHAVFTQAITNALSTGLPLYIPANTNLGLGSHSYMMTAPIRIIGEGDTSVLTRSGDNDNPLIYFNGGSPGSYYVGNLKIQSVQTTEPTNSSFNSAICACNTNDVTVENVTVSGAVNGFYMGIVFDGVNVGRISGAKVYKCFNRGIYLYHACIDVIVTDFHIDLSDSAGAPRGSYGLNTNPSDNTIAKRLVVSDGTIRGFTSHGLSASERYEDIIFANLVIEVPAEPDPNKAVCCVILQSANGYRGRKILLSNVRTIGGRTGIFANECDDFEIANCHAFDAPLAGIYILNSTRWTITGGSSSHCYSQGLLIQGLAGPGAVRDGQVIGHRANDCAGYGALVTGGGPGFVTEVGFVGGSYSDNGKGILALETTDRITTSVTYAHRSGVVPIELLGTNSSSYNNQVT